jgi:hypothetical protein
MISLGQASSLKVLKDYEKILGKSNPVSVILNSMGCENFDIKLHNTGNRKESIEFNISITNPDLDNRSIMQIVRSENGKTEHVLDILQNGEIELTDISEGLGNKKVLNVDVFYIDVQIVAAAIIKGHR